MISVVRHLLKAADRLKGDVDVAFTLEGAEDYAADFSEIRSRLLYIIGLIQALMKKMEEKQCPPSA